MQQQTRPAEVGLVLVGFSPAARLAAIAGHLAWQGRVLADDERVLYRRLGIGRAPLRRVYTPGTLAIYARAVLRRQRLQRAAEDTRQLGGDAVMVDGFVTRVWRPASPDDRPPTAEVVTAASAALHQRRR